MKFLKSIFYFIILLLVFSIVYPLIFDHKLFLGGDNANYYILAKGLAFENSYILFNSPSETLANHFPPGYPFLMSLLMRIGAESLDAMKILNGVFLLFSSFLMFHISVKLTKNNILSLIVALFVLLNGNLLEYSTVVMSEISFCFFLLLTIYFFLIFKEKKGGGKSPYLYLFGLSLIVLIYIRTQGVVVLLAFLLNFFFHKQWEEAIILFCLSFLALAPWQMRSFNLGGNTYMKQLTRVNPYDSQSLQMNTEDLGGRVKENLVRYISKEIPNALFPSIKVTYKDLKTGKVTKSPILHWVIGFSIILFALLGIISVPMYRMFFFLLFAGIFSVLMLWPQVWYGIRFFLPMVPLTFLFSILGLFYLVTKVFKLSSSLIESKRIAFVLVIFLFFQVNPVKALQKKANIDHPVKWNNFLKAGSWCKENIDSKSVISSRKPGLIYAVSNRKTTRFAYTNNPQEFFDYYKKDGVTHVIFEQLGFSQSTRYLLPIIRSEPEKFRLIKQYGGKIVTLKNGKKVQTNDGVWCYEYHPELGYNGEFKDGHRNGKGVYRQRNGAFLIGSWVNDTIEGPGVYVNQKGMKYSGMWVKGKKQGKVLITLPDGQMIESTAKNDIILNSGYLLDSDTNRIRKIQLK